MHATVWQVTHITLQHTCTLNHVYNAVTSCGQCHKNFTGHLPRNSAMRITQKCFWRLPCSDVILYFTVDSAQSMCQKERFPRSWQLIVKSQNVKCSSPIALHTLQLNIIAKHIDAFVPTLCKFKNCCIRNHGSCICECSRTALSSSSCLMEKQKNWYIEIIFSHHEGYKRWKWVCGIHSNK
jgi:hypothetical protein